MESVPWFVWYYTLLHRSCNVHSIEFNIVPFKQCWNKRAVFTKVALPTSPPVRCYILKRLGKLADEAAHVFGIFELEQSLPLQIWGGDNAFPCE